MVEIGTLTYPEPKFNGPTAQTGSPGKEATHPEATVGTVSDP